MSSLPSATELELYKGIQLRDAQIKELKDEITALRRHLATEPGPSVADPVTIPPALAAMLVPRLRSAHAQKSSSTVTTALTQRVKTLQDENTELYDLLKVGETGKLKEQVHSLKRVVARLETALQESHQVINSLSNELDKSYDTFMSTARQNNRVRSYSPQNTRESRPSYSSSAGGGRTASSSKAPPTGPRSYKKPRLSESSHTGPPLKQRGSRGPPGREREREQGRASPSHGMDVDDRDDERGGYARGRERDRRRDRDRDRPARGSHRATGNGHGRRTDRTYNGPNRDAHRGGLADRIGP